MWNQINFSLFRKSCKHFKYRLQYFLDFETEKVKQKSNFAINNFPIITVMFILFVMVIILCDGKTKYDT